MKTTTSFALLLAATSVASAAVTDPVGFDTKPITNGGVFNLVGLTLHGTKQTNTAVVGAPAGTTVTVTADSLDTLGAGPFLAEVTSGALAGAAELIDSVDAANDQFEIGATFASGLADGDTIVVRAAPTIASVFGTGADVLINKGDQAGGDNIYVPTGGGGFEIYWHTADSGFGAGDWTSAGGGAGAGGDALVYTDALFIVNKGAAPYNLIVTGEVKLTDSIVGTMDSFTYVGNPYPIGPTLDDSGIDDSAGFLKGDSANGDLILLADESNPGGYLTFHHTADSGFGAGSWTQAGGTGDGSTELSGGFIVQRRAAAPYNMGIAVPPTYPAP